MTRRRASVQVAECGHCAIEGPDEYGKYELVESWHCPVHGDAVLFEDDDQRREDELEDAA